MVAMNIGGGGGTPSKGGNGSSGHAPPVTPAPWTPPRGGKQVTGAATTTTDTSSQAVVSTLSGPIQWNPPAHRLTKAPTALPWMNQEYFIGDAPVWRADRAASGGTPFTEFGRLGALYTWDFTSTPISDQERNSAEYKAAVGNSDLALGRFANGRWGCVFHYNPTSIAYSVQSNEQIPAFNTAGDTSNLIVPGAASVSLELYFNRIQDVAHAGGLTWKNSANHYSYSVDHEQLQGIATRGTEYDIEYLYRACNGDPGDVFNVPYKTADYGFFMRIPLVLQLGPFRYIGFLTGVSVNHILFNTHMVPTFSSVSLSFARMITMGNATDSTSATGASGFVAGKAGPTYVDPTAAPTTSASTG